MTTRHYRLSNWYLFLAIFILAGSFAFPHLVSASSLQATGWAWADFNHIGWISFSGTATDGSAYGVYEDSSTGALSGYAWSSNIGWITFNASDIGTGCPTTPSNGTCAPTVELSSGKISGWARACSAFVSGCSGTLTGGWDGWISLSGNAADGSAYGVTQDSTTGEWSGYAWGSDNIGAISFRGNNTTDGSEYGVSVAVGSIDGVCSTAHYYCVVGNSANNVQQSPTSFTWSCVGLSGGKTVSCSETVTGLPDLTAGSVTPTAATVNTQVSLSSAITNQGAVSTGIGFTSLFQKADDSLGTNAITIGTATQSFLDAGGSGTATLSYTFTTTDPVYVRACADEDASMVGKITESDENNNCGPWTLVTVSTTPLTTPTANLFVKTVGLTTTTIESGQSVNLIWSSTNAVSCEWADGTNAGDIHGTKSFTPTDNPAYYSITCKNSSGVVSPPSVVTIFITLPTSPQVSISANPARVKKGDSSTISWTSTDTTSCAVKRNGVANAGAEWNVKNQLGVSDTITAQTLYKITCQTTDGSSVNDSVTVGIVPIFHEF